MNRDNQQEIGLVAWLAGIIDGEGTISLTISRRASNSQMIRTNPKVLVSNTDEAIIQQCLKAFSVIGVGNYQRTDRHPAGMICGTMVKKFKPVTVLEVCGFKRVRVLLAAVRPYLVGEKAVRADLLMKFIQGRIGYAEASKSAQNLAYRQEDVDNALAFLRITKSKQIEHIAKILNEHTREANVERRRQYKQKHGWVNKDLQNEQRRARRQSRCALDSREIVRTVRNEPSPVAG